MAAAISVGVMGYVSLLTTGMCGEKVVPIQRGKVQNVSNCVILEWVFEDFHGIHHLAKSELILTRDSRAICRRARHGPSR